MSIWRWGNPDWPEWNTPDPEGMYVLYDDHVAALAEARADERQQARQRSGYDWGYEQGVEDERQQARQRVEAVAARSGPFDATEAVACPDCRALAAAAAGGDAA